MTIRRSDDKHTFVWFVQASLGILLVVLLGVHLTVHHWVAPRGLLGYQEIVRYFNIPGIAWMELLFLVVVTAHCFMGLYSILLDLNLQPRVYRGVRWGLVATGIAIILYGFHLTRSIASSALYAIMIS